MSSAPCAAAARTGQGVERHQSSMPWPRWRANAAPAPPPSRSRGTVDAVCWSLASLRGAMVAGGGGERANGWIARRACVPCVGEHSPAAPAAARGCNDDFRRRRGRPSTRAPPPPMPPRPRRHASPRAVGKQTARRPCACLPLRRSLTARCARARACRALLVVAAVAAHVTREAAPTASSARSHWPSPAAPARGVRCREWDEADAVRPASLCSSWETLGK